MKSMSEIRLFAADMAEPGSVSVTVTSPPILCARNARSKAASLRQPKSTMCYPFLVVVLMPKQI